jgi:hypothetical protein
MTILPLTYLGGVEWFARLAASSASSVAAGADAGVPCRCVIDVGENWVKQTSRNRAEILTANGVAALTVPVHGYGQKIRTKDVRIDNSKRWQHTHWTSIVSAYRGSPYFDHYEERFAPVYERRFEFLTDLNLELLGIVTNALGMDAASIRISEDYIVAAAEDVDLRGKKALRRDGAQGVSFRGYTQVFYDRVPFVPGLSIVDLLFCEGTSSSLYLVG